MKSVCFYYSRFGRYVYKYLRKREVEGYSIDYDIYAIQRFLRYIYFKCNNPARITKEIFKDWTSNDLNVSPSTANNAISIVRRFLRYIKSQGEECWYPESLKPFLKRRQTYIPHIFTVRELEKIFHILDNLPYIPSEPLRHIAIPMMFRFLINFGLRESEICNIRLYDVFPDKIIIKDAKSKSFRLIPILPNFRGQLKNYIDKVFPDKSINRFLFLSSPDRKIQPKTLYYCFRQVLNKAGIPHGGKGIGPRIIDFRHTYCVMRIRQWQKEGRDLTTIIPYLSRFLGHSSFSQTAYYFSFVTDLFEDVRELEEKLYKGLFSNLNLEKNYELEEF